MSTSFEGNFKSFWESEVGMFRGKKVTFSIRLLDVTQPLCMMMSCHMLWVTCPSHMVDHMIWSHDLVT